MFCGFVGELYFFDDVVFVLGEVAGEVGVAEGAKWGEGYPCPIIFKILYCYIYQYYSWLLSFGLAFLFFWGWFYEWGWGEFILVRGGLFGN